MDQNQEHHGTRLTAGVARADITPPIGIRLNGSLRDGVAKTIESPLSLAALALAVDQTQIIIITVDMVIISPTEALAIREDVAETVGCSVQNVFFNISHSHATPSPPSWREFDPDSERDQFILNKHYHEVISTQAVSAAQIAVQNFRDAYLTSGTGTVEIGVNRREVLPDGTLVLGENPDGPMDPSVGVIRIDDTEGTPICAVVHYACHPDILGPKSEHISPDFVGHMRATLERIIDAPVLFLQGCAGDIDPHCGIVIGQDGINEASRLGSKLACEAGKVYQDLARFRVRNERVSWESSSGAGFVTGWSYRDSEYRTPDLSTGEVTLNLPLRPYPSLVEAATVREQATENLQEAMEREAPLSDLLTLRRRKIWADLQYDAIVHEHPAATEFTISVLKLGSLALVGLPAEIFVEIGLQIQDNSPFERTFVCGYTNGVLFYVPTAKSIPVGGYEVESHKNYLVRSGPTGDWEPEIVQATTHLLHSLTVSVSLEQERLETAS